jgi:hypothetical protein
MPGSIRHRCPAEVLPPDKKENYGDLVHNLPKKASFGLVSFLSTSHHYLCPINLLKSISYLLSAICNH